MTRNYIIGGLVVFLAYLWIDSQGGGIDVFAGNDGDESANNPTEQVDEALGGSYDDPPVPDAVTNSPDWVQDAVGVDFGGDEEATLSDGVNSPGGLPPGIDQIAGGLLSMGGN